MSDLQDVTDALDVLMEKGTSSLSSGSSSVGADHLHPGDVDPALQVDPVERREGASSPGTAHPALQVLRPVERRDGFCWACDLLSSPGLLLSLTATSTCCWGPFGVDSSYLLMTPAS